MGIPRLFASLVQRYPGIRTRLPSKAMLEGGPKTALLLDFNCAIHGGFAGGIPGVLSALQGILDQFAGPPGMVYLAIDGVVPKAKQVTQRLRRFNADSDAARNQISPGTPFMKELEAKLKDAYPWIHMSPSTEQGEGEHKILQACSRIVPAGSKLYIYGMDADMILLSMAAVVAGHEVLLLREDESWECSDVGTLRVPPFSIVSVNTLTDMLPFTVDTFRDVTLCFGNDFLPPLAALGLRVGGFDRLLKTCKQLTLDSFLKEVAADKELEWLQAAEKMYYKSLAIPPRDARDREELLPAYYVAKHRSICFGEPGWRERYYLTLFGTAREAQIQAICETYWRTVSWVRDYYAHNATTISWSWYYPWGAAPLIVDLVKYSTPVDPPSDMRVPTIEEQLDYILPKDASQLVKDPALMGYLFKRFKWEARGIIPP
jgi:5'-3' exonuclease